MATEHGSLFSHVRKIRRRVHVGRRLGGRAWRERHALFGTTDRASGPIGLVLATPLTVCLVVLGRHVERLKFLEILLGDSAALSPPEVAYQRMLAGDPMEASEQAYGFLKKESLVRYYEEIVMAGLRLAYADYQQAQLDDVRLARIRDTIAEIVDDLKEVQDPAEPSSPSSDSKGPALADAAVAAASLVPLPEQWRKDNAVLCVPGAGYLDEAVAIILAQLLDRKGIRARATESDSLSMARLFALDTNSTELICVCYLRRATTAQLRYAARRMRRKAPNAAIIIFAHTNKEQNVELVQLPEGVEVLEGSLEDAMARISAIAAKATSDKSSTTKAFDAQGASR